MYASFFGLRELPFNNTPDPRFFYSTPDHEEALASLIYAVEERKGFVLLTGEVGAGKTLVSRMMLRHFSARIAFANINHALQDAADLMEAVCTEFELTVPPGATNAQLVRMLQDYLLAQFAHDIPVVLVLDEAQDLPIDAFEQLRMIGNLEADDAKLLQIVIVGQPELQQMFASRELRQLRQRLFRSFHLPALNRKTTGAYVRHRLTIAACDGAEVFTDEAIDCIHRVSQGLPRLINTICDNVMLSAYSADRRAIDRAFIESVVEQMMMIGDSIGDGPGPGRALLDRARREPAETGARSGTVCTDERVDQVLAALAALAKRLDRIDAEVRTRKASPVQPDPTVEAQLRRRLTDSLNDELERCRGQLRAEALEAADKLAAVQHETVESSASLLEAKAVHARLQPVVEQTRTLIARAESALRSMSEREALTHEVADHIKAKVGQARNARAALEREVANTRRADKSAQTVLNRLVAQTKLSRELADTMAQMVDRLATTEGGKEPTPPGVTKEACAAVSDVTGASATEELDAIDQRRLLGMLSSTRESLRDLRSLARDADTTATSHTEP
jgi:type II secretory pathway predicted ATPase ExeA